jgi:hypothetical protein
VILTGKSSNVLELVVTKGSRRVVGNRKRSIQLAPQLVARIVTPPTGGKTTSCDEDRDADDGDVTPTRHCDDQAPCTEPVMVIDGPVMSAGFCAVNCMLIVPFDE